VTRLLAVVSVLLATSALALAAVGCGGGADTPDEAVHNYLDALASSDGDKACDQLTEETRDRLGRGRGSCKDVMEFLAALIPKDRRDDVKGTDVSVERSGDTAIATFDQPFGGGATRPQRLELKKEDGDWKISNLDTGGG
jgi:uncharacterized protein DUF4878